MTIIVHNCFHWIGFHYVNFLLEEGREVKGIDKIDSEKKENLYMLVGRNSSFEFMEIPDYSKAKVIIFIGEVSSTTDLTAERVFQIDYLGSTKGMENVTVIKSPILFGEWMDMKDNLITMEDYYKYFESVEFRSEAVYIGDFIESTYPILQSTQKLSSVSVFSKKIYLNESVTLENSIYIRENIPIEENVRKVLTHYKRYKDFY